jgi:hypothetical protein
MLGVLYFDNASFVVILVQSSKIASNTICAPSSHYAEEQCGQITVRKLKSRISLNALSRTKQDTPDTTTKRPLDDYP